MANMGPHGPRGIRGGKKAKAPAKTLKRLLKYTFSHYKIAVVFMFIAVIISSSANAVGSAMLAPIISELTPSEGVFNPSWNKIVRYVIIIGCVYFSGALCAFTYNRIMMYIAHGTLKKLRNEMFEKMHTLPLKYFDTHTHVDLISLYTNDVDTMRQLLS